MEMSQLKQPIFLKKDKKSHQHTIPGLEEQIFACRNKNAATIHYYLSTEKDEERILMSRLQNNKKWRTGF